MKRNIIFVGTILFIFGFLYLFLLGVVDAHQREFKEMRKGTPDSIRMNDTIIILKGNAD